MFNKLLHFSGFESCAIAHPELCLLHCVCRSKVEIQTNSLSANTLSEPALYLWMHD